jgi:hypothetical protein
VIVLDALRKQRNINDYDGDPISEQAVAECIKLSFLDKDRDEANPAEP